MRTSFMRQLLTLGAALSFTVITSSALASGGPVGESEFNCTASNGNLVVLRLQHAYSSELKGDALVYRSASAKGNMLTSMPLCIEAAKSHIAAALPTGMAAKAGLVVCGVKDKSKSTDAAVTIRANSKGYLLMFWQDSGRGVVRLVKGGQAALPSDASCLETPL